MRRGRQLQISLKSKGRGWKVERQKSPKILGVEGERGRREPVSWKRGEEVSQISKKLWASGHEVRGITLEHREDADKLHGTGEDGGRDSGHHKCCCEQEEGCFRHRLQPGKRSVSGKTKTGQINKK